MTFYPVIDLILALTFVCAGMNLTLAAYNVRARKHQPYWLSYAMIRTGFAVAVALIAESVYKSTQAAAAVDVPISWRVVLYCAALASACIGSFGILYDQRRRYAALLKHERYADEHPDRRQT